MTAVDVVVAGLGAMGSASLYHLSRRGLQVLGIDRFAPPHAMGSTHGRTRIIREAYFEHPSYVPLLRRAFEEWHALEAAWGEPLLVRTGGLMIGPVDGMLVSGAARSAREHAIAHELLDAAEVRRRFPAYAPPDDHVALLEDRAGLLLPERCVDAHLSLARSLGAATWTNTTIARWTATDDEVRLETTRGIVTAKHLVLATGPWIPEMLQSNGSPPIPLVVERQLSHWFAPRAHPERHGPDCMPLALWENEPGHLFATFADLGDGVKCGVHHDGAETDPNQVNRVVGDDERSAARELLAALMPDAAGRWVESRVCLYTNTPDSHFIVDQLPSGAALLVSACSGHGFKFASAIGALVAELVVDGTTTFDRTPFLLERFR